MQRMITMTVSLSVFVLSAAALAQQNKEPQFLAAGGAAPSFGVIDGIKDGKLLVRQTLFLPVQETRMETYSETVLVEGKEQKKTASRPVTITVMKRVTNQVAHDLADVRVFDTAGKPVAANRLATMFARPRIVVMAMPGTTVDPAFLKAVKESTPFVAFLSYPPAMPMPTSATPKPMPPQEPAVAPKAAP